jgi:hypothetical protein
LEGDEADLEKEPSANAAGMSPIKKAMNVYLQSMLYAKTIEAEEQPWTFDDYIDSR